MNNIPPKLRKQIDQDRFYKTCALYGQHNHACEGRITIDHAIEFAGKQLQEAWALVPVCAHGHGVDSFQDDATTSKELREWVALNRASEIDLVVISKAVSYNIRKGYLNGKYGVYTQIVPTPADLVKPAPADSKRSWYLIAGKPAEMIEKIRAFNKDILGVRTLPQETITAAIESEYRAIGEKLLEENKEKYYQLGFDK